MRHSVIDCHAHFYPPHYTYEEIQAHLEEESSDGFHLGKVVVVPETIAECDQVILLCAGNPLLAASVGLHPVRLSRFDVQADVDLVIRLLKSEAPRGSVCCVGEIGLDFSPWILDKLGDQDKARDLQRSVFAAQIEVAKGLGLPVNVHSRNAGHHAIGMLEEKGMLHRSLLHAFDGAPKHAVRAARLGALFSIPGSIAREDSFKRLVEKLPITSICLESDAPALSPLKGAQTWPLKSLQIAAEHIASIKGMTIEQVVFQTTANALQLFNFK